MGEGNERKRQARLRLSERTLARSVDDIITLKTTIKQGDLSVITSVFKGITIGIEKLIIKLKYNWH